MMASEVQTAGARPVMQPDARFGLPKRICFVVGGQKCGTNWVHRYLGAHPDACVPLLKETGYWSTIRPPYRTSQRLNKEARRYEEKSALHKLVTRMTQGRFRRTLAMAARFEDGDADGRHTAYADVMFQNYHGEDVLCEVDPANALLGRATYAEMAALGPDVRFALIMRDPLSRLKSGVRHTVYNQHGADGVTDERVAEVLRQVVAAGPKHLTFLRSRYDVTIAEMEAAVPAGQIAYFFYETFFTPEELARFTRSLDLPYRPAKLDRVSHAGAGQSAAFPKHLLDQAEEILAPTYAALRNRFGSAIPAQWRAAPDSVDAMHPADDDGSLKEQKS